MVSKTASFGTVTNTERAKRGPLAISKCVVGLSCHKHTSFRKRNSSTYLLLQPLPSLLQLVYTYTLVLEGKIKSYLIVVIFILMRQFSLKSRFEEILFNFI